MEDIFLVQDIQELAQAILDTQFHYWSESYDRCRHCGGKYHHDTEKYDCSPNCVTHIAKAILTGYNYSV